ncbi:MAG TPA: hypothetical protein VK903_12105 [Propionicimonas sp.]|nr:hypothetical protein [Propionicimonas sp.]
MAVLADAYDDDWERLWWVRADATARVVDAGLEHRRACEALMRRYGQYQAVPPTGPVLLATVDRWSGWKART